MASNGTAQDDDSERDSDLCAHTGPDTGSYLPAVHCRLRRPHHGLTVSLLQPRPWALHHAQLPRKPTRLGDVSGLVVSKTSGQLEPSVPHIPPRANHFTSLCLGFLSVKWV